MRHLALVLERRSGCLTERNRRDASSARSEEGAYREYVTDERRSDAKQIGDFATEGNPIGVLALGTLGLLPLCPNAGAATGKEVVPATAVKRVGRAWVGPTKEGLLTLYKPDAAGGFERATLNAWTKITPYHGWRLDWLAKGVVGGEHGTRAENILSPGDGKILRTIFPSARSISAAPPAQTPAKSGITAKEAVIYGLAGYGAIRLLQGK
jgi:hypothetical protein